MDWKFSEIDYQRPDFEQYQKKLDALCLAVREAKDFETVRQAILEKNRLQSELEAMATVAFCRAYHDVSEDYYQEEMNRNDVAMAMLKTEPFSQAILDSKFRAEIDAAFGEQYCLRLRQSIVLSANGKELRAEISELCNRYQQIKARISYDLHGEKVSEARISQALKSADRETRRDAFEAMLDGVLAHREELSQILRDLVKKRNALARANGFENYVEYANLENRRFGYGDKELTAFVEEVRQYIVPLFSRIQKAQRNRLGLDVLYPYDTSIYFSDGGTKRVERDEDLAEAARKMYYDLSPEAGELFDEMQRHETFDIAYSDKKIYGMGFMTPLSGKWQIPYIFANSNGTASDVAVYTHEFGHAYQMALTMRNQLFDYYDCSPDYHEIHSKTMELLSYPYAPLFFGKDADKSLLEQKSNIVKEMCAYCQHYAFESWLYRHEDASMEEWAAKLNDLAHAFGRERNDQQWSEKIRLGALLLDDMAIYTFPLYVVSYALSEVCALTLSREIRDDPKKGWAKYRSISACGGSKAYARVLADAGLPLPYAEGSVKNASNILEDLIFNSEE